MHLHTYVPAYKRSWTGGSHLPGLFVWSPRSSDFCFFSSFSSFVAALVVTTLSSFLARHSTSDTFAQLDRIISPGAYRCERKQSHERKRQTEKNFFSPSLVAIIGSGSLISDQSSDLPSIAGRSVFQNSESPHSMLFHKDARASCACACILSISVCALVAQPSGGTLTEATSGSLRDETLNMDRSVAPRPEARDQHPMGLGLVPAADSAMSVASSSSEDANLLMARHDGRDYYWGHSAQGAVHPLPRRGMPVAGCGKSGTSDGAGAVPDDTASSANDARADQLSSPSTSDDALESPTASSSSSSDASAAPFWPAQAVVATKGGSDAHKTRRALGRPVFATNKSAKRAVKYVALPNSEVQSASTKSHRKAAARSPERSGTSKDHRHRKASVVRSPQYVALPNAAIQTAGSAAEGTAAQPGHERGPQYDWDPLPEPAVEAAAAPVAPVVAAATPTAQLAASPSADPPASSDPPGTKGDTGSKTDSANSAQQSGDDKSNSSSSPPGSSSSPASSDSGPPKTDAGPSSTQNGDKPQETDKAGQNKPKPSNDPNDKQEDAAVGVFDQRNKLFPLAITGVIVAGKHDR